MSQYIDSKNQTLLWNTIQKHPYTITVFPPGNDTSKTEWFKRIIASVYNEIQSRNISNIQLLELNKETLRRMTEDMRQYITVSNSKANSQSFIPQNNTLDSDRSYSRESILQNKTTVFERDLLQRQNEYENLHQKPLPPTVKFEEINDGIIKNMDELIEQQRRERENDLKVISGTYLNQASEMNGLDQLLSTSSMQKGVKPPLNIDHENPNIQIDILEIPTEREHIEDKQISWNISEAIESKIVDLTRKYTELLNFLERKIPNFKEEFSPPSSEIMDL